MSEAQNKYIVVFKEGVSKDQINQYAEELKNNGGQVNQHLSSVNGFSATLTDTQLQLFKSNLQGDVLDFIEPDGFVTTQL